MPKVLLPILGELGQSAGGWGKVRDAQDNPSYPRWNWYRVWGCFLIGSYPICLRVGGLLYGWEGRGRFD